MLSILDRYFLRELSRTMAAIAAVLCVIAMGALFSNVLQHVAGGSYPLGVMFQVMGLRMVGLLTILLPLATFFGVLWGLGRMYQQSEMHVLLSSGMGVSGLLRPLGVLAVWMTILGGLVSLWLSPMAERATHALIVEANRSVVAVGLGAGRFVELPGRRHGVIFTDAMSRDGNLLGRVFLASEQETAHGARILRVISGKSAHVYQASHGEQRFLALRQGWQYEIPLGADNWRWMHYRRNDVALSALQVDDNNDEVQSLSTAALRKIPTPVARAELAWRFVAPTMSITLLMLALPLARQRPREPRFGRLLLAALSFYLYYTLLMLCRSQMMQGHWRHAESLWLLNLLVFAAGMWMFWRQHASRRGADGRASR